MTCFASGTLADAGLTNVFLHQVTDLVIAIAYFVLCAVLLYFVVRRGAGPLFVWMFWLVCALFGLSGLTFALDSFAASLPVQGLSAVIKVATVFVAWAVVFGLVPTVPRALAMRSHEELEREIHERQRMQSKIQRREQRQTALANLGALALHVDDFDQFCQITVRTIAETLDVPMAAMFSCHNSGTSLTLRESVGMNPLPKDWSMPVAGHKTIEALVLESVNAVRVDDMANESRFGPSEPWQGKEVVSSLAVPIIGRETLLGVIEVHTRQFRLFTPDETEFLNSAATLLALAHARQHGEQARRELADIVQSSDDAIIGKMLDGTIVSWNRAAEKLFGYTAEEVLGKSITILLPVDSSDLMQQIFRRIRHGERVEHYETTRVRKDGRSIQVSLTISPIIDHAGRVRGYSTIARDITQRKRAEAKFRTLLESAPDGMVIVRQDGTIELVNAQAEHLFGKTREEMVGDHVETLLPQRFRGLNRHPAGFFAYPAQNVAHSVELFGLRKDGSEFPIEIRQNPLETEEGILFSNAIRDVTERKRADAELRMSESRFRSLVERNIIGILLADGNGRIQEANDAFLRLTGYARDELETGEGIRLDTLTPPEYLPMDLWAGEQLKKHGQCEPYEKEYVRKDGSTVPILIGAARLDGPSECVCFVLDITERKRAEHQLHEAFDQLELRVQERTAELARSNKALEAEIAERRRIEDQIRAALREKELLLKEVQHRVKNNLQVVASLLNLQTSYVHDPRDLELLRESQHRVRSMALIHERFYQSKDLSKIDFADYLRNLTTYLAHAYGLQEESIALRTDLDSAYLGVDTAIPCGLIINELVSNAVKYAFPQGKVGHITIELAQSDEKYSLVVRDDGVGLPKDLDLWNTPSLGLQLVTTLIEQIDATIETRNGQGTTFEILFKEVEYRKRN